MANCPSYKYNRVEFIDYFRRGIEDDRHAIFPPHSHFCSFFIQATTSIGAGEFGAPAATRYAQTVGEAPAGVARRPSVDKGIRKLIRQMQSANVGWGAPRIHGELLKLGIDISQATVSKYMIRQQKPPSQTWRTFLESHADCIAGIDFFTVPTATFRILYVFIVLSHDRRHIVHFNVTAHPTARWTARQLVEAFPIDSAPRFLLRDRDAIYGEKVRRRIKSLGIEEVVTAPRSPWQNPFVERIIGSIRRDCLDHIIALNEPHLRRILREYFKYYLTCRTHPSLNKDPPETRTVEPPAMGNIIAFPHVGGLHHRYGRIAA